MKPAKEISNSKQKKLDVKKKFHAAAENGAYPPNQNGLIHPQLSLKWA